MKVILSVFLLSCTIACTPQIQQKNYPALQIIADGDVHYEAIHDGTGEFTAHIIFNDPLAQQYITGLATANARAAANLILGDGKKQNRVDFVIVGDGYTSTEIRDYQDHAANIAERMFDEEPLRTYKNYFNIYRVDVVSNQSGVTNDPKNGVKKKTALGMNYFCSGIERLLCANMESVKKYAANAPAADTILAVANSTKYGGAGYWKDNVATLAGRNPNSLEVALHEVAHSFAQLGDEYSDAGANSTDCASKANGAVWRESEMLAKSLKWFRWLDLSHIGTFEGSCYKSKGIYRPTANSKMRSLGQPFYEVNTEQYIFSIYKRVRPIDSATPAGTYSAQSTLFVQPLRPQGEALSIRWYLDGQELPAQQAEAIDVSQLPLSSGRHQISVKVTDVTARVRDEANRAKLMSETRSWTIVK